jgi:deoxyribodipyrimidine photolyase-related protein
VTPNVLSMSQYADGWNLATKPYISSWNYINKMSDFCWSCEYNVKNKYEPDSCPFNYLYWNFISDQKDTFQKTRQNFVLKNLEKIDIDKIKNKFITDE